MNLPAFPQYDVYCDYFFMWCCVAVTHDLCCVVVTYDLCCVAVTHDLCCVAVTHDLC